MRLVHHQPVWLLPSPVWASIKGMGQQSREAFGMLIGYCLRSYQDPVSGHACETTAWIDEKETRAHLPASHISRSLEFRGGADDFADTVPEVFYEEHSA